MKEFRLRPDDPPKEKERKRTAMLRRIEQEKQVKRESLIGQGPQGGLSLATVNRIRQKKGLPPLESL